MTGCQLGFVVVMCKDMTYHEVFNQCRTGVMIRSFFTSFQLENIKKGTAVEKESKLSMIRKVH